MKIPGISFEQAYANHIRMPLAGTQVPFVSLDDLIDCKMAAGRHKDLGDADALQWIKQTKQKN